MPRSSLSVTFIQCVYLSNFKLDSSKFAPLKIISSNKKFFIFLTQKCIRKVFLVL